MKPIAAEQFRVGDKTKEKPVDVILGRQDKLAKLRNSEKRVSCDTVVSQKCKWKCVATVRKSIAYLANLVTKHVTDYVNRNFKKTI